MTNIDKAEYVMLVAGDVEGSTASDPVVGIKHDGTIVLFKDPEVAARIFKQTMPSSDVLHNTPAGVTYTKVLKLQIIDQVSRNPLIEIQLDWGINLYGTAIPKTGSDADKFWKAINHETVYYRSN